MDLVKDPIPGTIVKIAVPYAFGAGDEARAVRYQTQANTLGLMVRLSLTVILHLVLPALFGLYGAEGEVLAGGPRYMRVLASGAVFVVLTQTLNAGLMARGDTKAFRNVLIAMAIINVGLDPLLMFGVTNGGVQVIPPLREAGIAIATVLLQGVGA